MAEALPLAAEDLAFTHPGAARPAVEGVSFAVTPGARLAIVGPNGAGKTTLLSLLSGLEVPARGGVEIGGMRLSGKTLPEVRRRVGVVFQNPDDQMFCPTVGDDIAFGPEQHRWPRERIDRAVDAIAAELDLGALLDKSPLHVSRGERQRAALATALVLDPGVLLLDEPTAALDPRRRRQMIALLSGFQQTLIIATHDLDLALDLCPRTLLLHRGRGIAEGETESLLRDRELLESHELELPLRLQ